MTWFHSQLTAARGPAKANAAFGSYWSRSSLIGRIKQRFSIRLIVILAVAGASVGLANDLYVADPRTYDALQQRLESGDPMVTPFTRSLATVEDYAEILNERTVAGLGRELSKFYIEKGYRVYLRTVNEGQLLEFYPAALQMLDQQRDRIVVLTFTPNRDRYIHIFNQDLADRLGEEGVRSVIAGMISDNVEKATPEELVIGSIISLVRGIVKTASAPRVPDPVEAQEESEPKAPEVAPDPQPKTEPFSAPQGEASPPPVPVVAKEAPTPAVSQAATPPIPLFIGGAAISAALALAFLLYRSSAKKRSRLRMLNDPTSEPSMPVYDRIPKRRREPAFVESPVVRQSDTPIQTHVVQPRRNINPPKTPLNTALSPLAPQSSHPAPRTYGASESASPSEGQPIATDPVDENLLRIALFIHEIRSSPPDRRPLMIRGLEILMLGLRELSEKVAIERDRAAIQEGQPAATDPFIVSPGRET